MGHQKLSTQVFYIDAKNKKTPEPSFYFWWNIFYAYNLSQISNPKARVDLIAEILNGKWYRVIHNFKGNTFNFSVSPGICILGLLEKLNQNFFYQMYILTLSSFY